MGQPVVGLRERLAAEEFPQFCATETELFSRLLGSHVQRLATIAHGEGVCTTHVPHPVAGNPVSHEAPGPAGCGSGPSESGHTGGEANLHLPDLGQVSFLGGLSGRHLLMIGLIVCLAGLTFGIVTYSRLKNLPVHESMREVSELI